MGIIIINNSSSESNCVSSIKNQTYKNLKVISMGGDYNKAQLFNKGLETLPPTDYIIFIEGHQTLMPTFVETTLKTVKRQEVFVGVIYTNFLDNNRKVNVSSFDRSKLTAGYNIPNLALIKRNIFETCGLFDESLESLEGWDMWLRISEKYVLYHIPEYLYSGEEKVDISTKLVTSNREKILNKTLERIKK